VHRFKRNSLAFLPFRCSSESKSTEALRHVADDSGAPAAGEAVREAKPDRWYLRFWSADWTPWRALNHLGRPWPALRFDCRPTYEAS